ncbi:glutathione S-transferase N-terminal domain-containing protein [Nitrospirillum sp. BR 11164]|uniref:glutathione S-transferase family protein n=1 Tax=Nitrospirillum sp. BR 11164 TaxID=3104324 RepID=UPI002AFF75C3|nr:glutathione S-transferase N-terminal domain-containing protein [Nitrospirillum sp. BR 11164]MEA1651159.1 glutathione S-transferase N-terminal domain-containing protein [Nitrospirillum sp. BR 11164]
MLEVYAFATPNSIKVPIALEELGLDYELHPINVRQGEQKAPDFVALNPNAKVPVLVDGHLVLTESAAILVHLAEKTGRLLPVSGDGRARVFEQLFFHASGLSPAFGQSGFFQRSAAEPQPIAIERFLGEAKRTVSVLDGLLSRHRYAAGDTFTIADIAHFGWLWRREFAGVGLEDTPHVARWYAHVAARPAVQRALSRVNALLPSV